MFFILMCLTNAFAGETTIRIEEPAGLERSGWPVDLGFPFSRNDLTDISTLSVMSPEGLLLPVQKKVLSRWDNGSIRWVHVLFPADLEPAETAEFRLQWGNNASVLQPRQQVSVSRTIHGVAVNTGPLDVVIGNAGCRVFDNVVVNGRKMVSSEHSTIRIVTADGDVYETSLDDDVTLNIVEEGPLRAVVNASGRHRSTGGNTLFDYTCTYRFYAGKTWCEVDYAFTNTESPDSVDVASISVVTGLAPAKGSTKGSTSEYKIDKMYEFDEPFSIYSGAHDYFGVFGGATIYRHDGTEVTGMGYESEARSRWWADLSDNRKGVTVSLRDMSQNYPKSIRIHPDSIVVDLYPSRKQQPLSIHQGWRKTHTILYYFHDGNVHEANSRELCFSWQAPVILWSPHHIKCGSAGDLFPYSPNRYPIIERSLRAGFITYEGGVGRGMIDYGDTRGAGSGERGNFMQNNAYDTPWVAYLMFLRKGERRYWTRALSGARHIADIDIVHYSTKNDIEIGGIRIHGPNHVQYNAEAIPNSSVAPNHEWVEGLLMTYHLTGERQYLDLSIGVADHILRALEAGWIMPPYPAKWNGARNLGWPLLILTVMYDETSDERYLDGARRIVQGLEDLQLPNGSFPITFGPRVSAAPLHNAIVMEALGRYHALTDDETAKDIYMRCIESTFRDLRFPDGEFMYVDHPDYRSGYTSMPWGGFHFAWLYTGDKTWLESVYPLIVRQLKQRNFGVYGEGALSYQLRGMLFYLTHADRAGILEDIPAY